MHALYQRAMQFSMRPSTGVGENLTVVALLKTKPQHKPRKPCSPCSQEAMSVAREVCVRRDLKPQLQLGSKRAAPVWLSFFGQVFAGCGFGYTL